jgi:hypothetical protein
MLEGLLSTIRDAQRGTPPSDVGPPHSIGAHMADALAVLDAFALDQALGDRALLGDTSRLLGLLLIDLLGADPGILAEQDANLRRGLTPEQRARVDGVEGA